MANPRIFIDQPLQADHTLALPDNAVQHLVRVLRLQAGDAVRLFNGDGYCYQGELVVVSKRQADVRIQQQLPLDPVPPLEIIVGQVISKGDRMDFTIQKATELGASRIVPLWSERCDVRLNGDRLEKKQQHWHKVAVSACEQCGRNRLPDVDRARSLTDWLEQSMEKPGDPPSARFVLHPHQQQPLGSVDRPERVWLLVGPEGGFTDLEVQAAEQAGFRGLLLGPRILRTETAALAAISVIQHLWGDFSVG